MKLEDMRLADILANDPDTTLVADERERYGYVTIECPNGDGTDDHLLHVCNPCPEEDLPAIMFCLNLECADITTEQFVAMLGSVPPKRLN